MRLALASHGRFGAGGLPNVKNQEAQELRIQGRELMEGIGRDSRCGLGSERCSERRRSGGLQGCLKAGWETIGGGREAVFVATL